MSDYVSKPISTDALAETLALWLPNGDLKKTSPKEISHSFSKRGFAHKVFDQESLLERLQNDADLARLVVTTFLNDVPQQVEKLRFFIERADTQGAAYQAHLLKGAAANVGCEAFRAIASEIEQAAKVGDIGQLTTGICDLDYQFIRLMQVMASRERTE
jgi:protein-histidine pros-kinase